MEDYDVVGGVGYKKPQVVLVQNTGIGTSELGARTCYNSFESSENEAIREFNEIISETDEQSIVLDNVIKKVNDIDDSKLLDDLSWTHFHHSILEHSVLTYYIKGTSRSCLHELVRHRIASPSVQSTRYTMSKLLNIFVVADKFNSYELFEREVIKLDMFVTDIDYNKSVEIPSIWNKLQYQKTLNDDIYTEIIAKSSLGYLDLEDADEMLRSIQDGKAKRNVGDKFKHIVSDNWKVNLVFTINLRSLKNFLELRDSGAAYFQIRNLAKEMIKVTPIKQLKLISKKYKAS